MKDQVLKQIPSAEEVQKIVEAITKDTLEMMKREDDEQKVIDKAIACAIAKEKSYPKDSKGEFLAHRQLNAFVEDFGGLMYFLENRGEDDLTESILGYDACSEIVPELFNDKDYLAVNSAKREGWHTKSVVIGSLSPTLLVPGDFPNGLHIKASLKKPFAHTSVWTTCNPFSKKDISLFTKDGTKFVDILEFPTTHTTSKWQSKYLRKVVFPIVPVDQMQRDTWEMECEVLIMRDESNDFTISQLNTETGVLEDFKVYGYFATIDVNTKSIHDFISSNRPDSLEEQ